MFIEEGAKNWFVGEVEGAEFTSKRRVKSMTNIMYHLIRGGEWT